MSDKNNLISLTNLSSESRRDSLVSIDKLDGSIGGSLGPARPAVGRSRHSRSSNIQLIANQLELNKPKPEIEPLPDQEQQPEPERSEPQPQPQPQPQSHPRPSSVKQKNELHETIVDIANLKHVTKFNNQDSIGALDPNENSDNPNTTIIRPEVYGKGDNKNQQPLFNPKTSNTNNININHSNAIASLSNNNNNNNLPPIGNLNDLFAPPLKSYLNIFINYGYDDLNFLLSMTEEGWKHMIQTIESELEKNGKGETIKGGHKLQLIARLKAEKFRRSQNGYVPLNPNPRRIDINEANENQIPGSLSSDSSSISPTATASNNAIFIIGLRWALTRHWFFCLSITIISILISTLLISAYETIGPSNSSSTTGAWQFLYGLCIFGFVVGSLAFVFSCLSFCLNPEQRNCSCLTCQDDCCTNCFTCPEMKCDHCCPEENPCAGIFDFKEACKDLSCAETCNCKCDDCSCSICEECGFKEICNCTNCELPNFNCSCDCCPDCGETGCCQTCYKILFCQCKIQVS